MVVNIRNDDTSKESEGVKKGAKELSREPKEEPEEAITFGESIFGVDSGVAHEDAPNSPVLLLTGEDTTGDSAFVTPTMSVVYVTEWGIAREYRLM